LRELSSERLSEKEVGQIKQRNGCNNVQQRHVVSSSMRKGRAIGEEYQGKMRKSNIKDLTHRCS
jgi:hypothetical protein